MEESSYNLLLCQWYAKVVDMRKAIVHIIKKYIICKEGIQKDDMRELPNTLKCNNKHRHIYYNKQLLH